MANWVKRREKVGCLRRLEALAARKGSGGRRASRECLAFGGPGEFRAFSFGGELRDDVGQAKKCTWWMPRHEPATKDVASCEKPRGAASEQ